MILDEKFDPKKSLFLYEYKKKFIFLKKLISNNNFPSSLLLSGNKGIGKFTLISHLLHFYFDNINYDDNNNQIKKNTAFHYQFLDNLFPNILYLSSSNYKNVTIEDIRKLKQKLLITPILNKKRFIILDDVETFNLNCLNALLKILEEPGKNNHFILIDNKSKPLINTIKSRCIKIKFVLDELSRVKIINNLINFFNHKLVLNIDLIKASPGNFLKFNFIFDNNLDINENFSTNIKSILNIYKKDKNIFIKDLLIFYVNYWFQKNYTKTLKSNNIFVDKRIFLLKQINDFFIYNLNQQTLLNSIESNLNNG